MFDVNSWMSALLAIVAGLADFSVGLIVLRAASMMSGSGLQIMNAASAQLLGYFLLALGVIVSLTGLYMLNFRMMMRGLLFGRLMIGYGTVMLILGVGMTGQLFNVMMQGSLISGFLMILIGCAMLFVGFTMSTGSPQRRA